jgi:hypothetical protein
MINIFTILLIIVFIIFIRNKNKENFISVSPNDKMFELSKQNKINFNYKIIPPNPTISELNQTILPIEKQFLKEQEYGANRNILYPNTCIDYIDTTGKPQWSSRDNKVGIADNLISPRVLNSYGFNKEKISNPGGIIDPDEFLENANAKFNKTFEKCKLDDEDVDFGYGDIMEKSSKNRDDILAAPGPPPKKIKTGAGSELELSDLGKYQ